MTAGRDLEVLLEESGRRLEAVAGGEAAAGARTHMHTEKKGGQMG